MILAVRPLIKSVAQPCTLANGAHLAYDAHRQHGEKPGQGNAGRVGLTPAFLRFLAPCAATNPKTGGDNHPARNMKPKEI
jgi:hypothetical protein